MRKTLEFLLLAVLLCGCGKEIKYSNDFASVAIVNASPATPATGFIVYVDTMSQTAVLAYRSNTGYLSVKPGTRNVDFKNVINFQTVRFGQFSADFATNTASTIFVYDTATATNNTLKTLRLSDDLTLPATGMVKVRVVPLAVNQGPVDFTFLRTSAIPNDSVTVANKNYVGASPNDAAIQALSAFSTTLPLGSYTIKAKVAGAQTVLASSTATLNGTTGFYGIYSIYLTGGSQRLPLGVSLVNHYR
ncbi:MAG TPA: DUF4397 domain-containing protein [Segetibacter sp.]